MFGFNPKPVCYIDYRPFTDRNLIIERRLLGYKCEETGKSIIEIPRFAPSSKLCSVCGKINKQLKLGDRVWTCSCGTVHDRDHNASVNIKVFSWLQLHRPSGTVVDVKQSLLEGLSILQHVSVEEVSNSA